MDFTCNVIGIDGMQRRRAGCYPHPTDHHGASDRDHTTPSHSANCAVGRIHCNGHCLGNRSPSYAHPSASNGTI